MLRVFKPLTEGERALLRACKKKNVMIFGKDGRMVAPKELSRSIKRSKVNANWGKNETYVVITRRKGKTSSTQVFNTDDLGRVRRVSGSKGDKAARNNYQQGLGGGRAPNSRAGDQGGHQLPTEGGGTNLGINHLPQARAVNNGAPWKRAESAWANDPGAWRFNKVEYPGTSHRPSGTHVSQYGSQGPMDLGSGPGNFHWFQN